MIAKKRKILILTTVIALTIMCIATMLVGRYAVDNDRTLETFNITYLDVGGTAFSGQFEGNYPISHTYGEKTVLVNPIKNDYQFLGWFFDINGLGAKETVIAANVRADITLHAKWQSTIEIPDVFSINYLDVGGTAFSGALGNNTPTTHTVGVTTVLVAPSREGHQFLGWFLNVNGEGNPLVTLGANDFSADINLYAKWQANTYTVIYNANRPDNASNQIIGTMASSNFTFGMAENLRANDFALLGWTFTSWNTAADGSGLAFADLEEVLNLSSINNANINLYAQWTANTYTVVYEKNHPNATGTMTSQIHTFDIMSNLSANQFVLTGFGFRGWNTAADGSGTAFADLEEVVNLSAIAEARVILFAQWEEGVFTITFDANGGNAVAPMEVNYRQPFSLPSSELIGTGGFLGWVNKDTLELMPQTGIWTIPHNVTLIAQWIPHDDFTVTFDLNGGEALVNNTQVVTFREAYILPTPTKAGHTFLGWHHFGNIVPLSGNWQIASDVTLVAHWANDQDIDSFTITFDVNGGEPLANQVVGLGLAYTLPTPTRLGFAFTGWYFAGSLIAQNGIWTLEDDVELIANWLFVPITLYFDVNGGNILPSNTITITEPEQALVFPIPTREGHTFLGWHFINLGNKTLVDESNIYDFVWFNANLVALWEAESFTITFDVNGGSPVAPLTVTFGEVYNLPLSELIGFGFLGWVNLTDLILVAQNGIWNIASDVILIAQWAPPLDFTVEFDTNGGNALADMTVTFSLAYTLPEPTRTGYTFLGWHYNGVFIPLSGNWNIANDVTLVAQWLADTEYSFIITFDAPLANPLIPSQTVGLGLEYMLPTPSRLGFAFIGWFYENTLIPQNGIWVIEADITLTAQWLGLAYVVSFDVAGGNSLSDMPVTMGEDYSLPTPTREGYTFLGWEHNGTVIALTGVWDIAYDVLLLALWEANVSTVTFDVNGGDELANNTMMIEFNQTFTLPTPLRTGYTFLGWFNGLNLVNQTGIWDNPAVDVYLIAQWLVNNYSITFENTGVVQIPPMTVTFGQAFTLPDDPEMNGHTFAYWSLNGVAFVKPIVWDLTTDITLRAEWTANTYTITFDVNQGETLIPNTQNLTFGQAFLLPEPTRTGYEFIGWHYNEVFVPLSGNSWFISGNITLVAQWSYDTFIITFDVNGGNALVSDTQTVGFGVSYSLPTPTRTGHTFAGWFNGPDLVEQTGIWNLASNTILVAEWTANTYTITFDVNGGDTLVPNTQDVVYDDNFSLPTPTRTGHEFAGWLHNGNPFTAGTWNIPNDITLIADWVANDYIITFDVNGGDYLPDMTVTFDQPFVLPIPTRTGHEFAGWLNSGIPFISGTWNLTHDVTLEATWTANTYTITFFVNGGDALDPNTQDVTFGTSFSLPTPTRIGHTFAGWYHGTTNVALTGNWTIADNVTLVAEWTANTYTITFEVNGGNAITDMTVTFGTEVLLPTATKTGYTFDGWLYGSNPILQTIHFNWDYNITLSARWTANTYTITFDVNGGVYLPDMTVTFNQPFVLPTPTRTGHQFLGWFDDLTLIAQSGIWSNASDLTLRADWSANTYIITFDLNNGTMLEPISMSVIFGQSFTLPTPTKIGHTFAGWFNGTDLVEQTGVWDIAADITLVAAWTAGIYTIELWNRHGTSGSYYLYEIVTLTFGQPFVLPIPSQGAHWTFSGWFHDTTYVPAIGSFWDIAYDAQLFGHLTNNSVVINFDLNGGDGFIDPYTTLPDVSVELPIPTRTGHTFVGWEDQHGTLLPNPTSWSISGNFTLIAQWSANTYIITFDANGGTMWSGHDTMTLIFGESYVLNTPFSSRPGHTFGAWQFDGADIASTGTSWNISGNVTLIARWEPIETFVTFDTNGGNVIEPMTIVNATTYTLPIPVRAGFTFTRWYRWGSVGDMSAWVPLTGVWNQNYTNLTLSAGWTANSYEVWLDSNGADELFSYINVTYGSAFSLPTPTRVGHTFAGWQVTEIPEHLAEFQDIILPQTGSWFIPNAITATAQWTPNNYIVTFDPNHGDPLPPASLTFGMSYTLPTPTRLGHTFVGWYLGLVHIQTTGIWDIAEDIQLFAQWTANTYTVTFNSAGGANIASQNITFDSSYNLPTPARRGHTFDGWLHNGISIPLTGIWEIVGNITLVASWQANLYIVTFDLNGGEPFDFVSMGVQFGESYSLPEPVNSGYLFTGWLHGSDLIPLTGVWEIPYDVTLVAQWFAEQTFLIYFDVNGGDSLGSSTQRVVLGADYSLPIPFRAGHRFIGWFNEGVLFPPEGVWLITSDVSLIAQWTEVVIIEGMWWDLNGSGAMLQIIRVGVEPYFRFYMEGVSGTIDYEGNVVIQDTANMTNIYVEWDGTYLTFSFFWNEMPTPLMIFGPLDSSISARISG
ncbi:MAG: InlB B-repeat-containing protein [Erysipelotrichales bacterium]|nr:InlB B-repeat-containing protein [Erysipelotrichales bacterium]